jgi:hypothetical protein
VAAPLNKEGIVMARIIDLESIKGVLLSDGNWNKVRKGTFQVDGYLNAEDGEVVRGKGISTKDGATWLNADTGDGFACPIRSIEGFKYLRRTKDDTCEY